MGTAGMVLGVIGLNFYWLPTIALMICAADTGCGGAASAATLAIARGIAGLALSATARARQYSMMSVIGIMLNSVALGLGIIYVALTLAATLYLERELNRFINNLF